MDAIKRMNIGPFELAMSLAKGGMAEVFIGRRPGSQALVVVKLLNETSRGKPETAKLFLAEGRVMSGMHHPNVIRIIEHGFHNDQAYIAMEYLAGDHMGSFVKTLRKKQELLDPAVAAHMFYQMARGLAYFHSAKDETGKELGLVHRDISPQNIFVCLDGTVKLLDFGVVLLSEEREQEEKGKLRGKIGYMSPEQVLDQDMNHLSDQFSLGIVMWESLTGKRLFKRKDQLSSLKAIVQKNAYPVLDYRKDVPPELAYIIMRCLERKPEKRFPTTVDLQKALMGFASSRVGRIDEAAYSALVQKTLGQAEQQRAQQIQAILRGHAPPTFEDLSSSTGSVSWDDGYFSLPPLPERLPDLGQTTGLSDGDPVMALREAINKGAPQLTLQAYHQATAHGQMPNLDPRLALRLADILQREGLPLDAARMCRVAAEKDLDGALAPEAILRGAELLLGPANKQEPGVSMLRFLLQRYPNHELAPKALAKIRSVYKGERDPSNPRMNSFSQTRTVMTQRTPARGLGLGRTFYLVGAGLLLLFLLAFFAYLIFPEHRHYLGLEEVKPDTKPVTPVLDLEIPPEDDVGKKKKRKTWPSQRKRKNPGAKPEPSTQPGGDTDDEPEVIPGPEPL